MNDTEGATRRNWTIGLVVFIPAVTLSLAIIYFVAATVIRGISAVHGDQWVTSSTGLTSLEPHVAPFQIQATDICRCAYNIDTRSAIYAYRTAVRHRKRFWTTIDDALTATTWFEVEGREDARWFVRSFPRGDRPREQEDEPSEPFSCVQQVRIAFEEPAGKVVIAFFDSPSFDDYPTFATEEDIAPVDAARAEALFNRERGRPAPTAAHPTPKGTVADAAGELIDAVEKAKDKLTAPVAALGKRDRWRLPTEGGKREHRLFQGSIDRFWATVQDGGAVVVSFRCSSQQLDKSVTRVMEIPRGARRAVRVPDSWRVSRITIRLASGSTSAAGAIGYPAPE